MTVLSCTSNTFTRTRHLIPKIIIIPNNLKIIWKIPMFLLVVYTVRK